MFQSLIARVFGFRIIGSNLNIFFLDIIGYLLYFSAEEEFTHITFFFLFFVVVFV